MQLSIEEIVTAIVSSSTIAASLSWIVFKLLLQRLADDAIDHSFAKKLSRYNNSLYRSTKAYELLLDKELSFYDALGPLTAGMIVDIQDLAMSVSNSSEEYWVKISKESLMNLLESTIKMKSIVLEKESFLPKKVFLSCTNVIKVLQDGQEFWAGRVAEMHTQYPKNESEYAREAQCRSDALLRAIGQMQILIQDRLATLSECE